LQAAFLDFAEQKDEGTPSLHHMFSEITQSMSRNHYDWFEVGYTLDGEPKFLLVEHTHEEWDQIISAMNQDIANRIAKRLLGDA
jgi:hypothetical protein